MCTETRGIITHFKESAEQSALFFVLCGLRPRIVRQGCTFEGTLPSKLRSQNAGHTPVRSQYVQKNRLAPFAIAFRIHNYEQVPIVQRKSLADR